MFSFIECNYAHDLAPNVNQQAPNNVQNKYVNHSPAVIVSTPTDTDGWRQTALNEIVFKIYQVAFEYVKFLHEMISPKRKRFQVFSRKTKKKTALLTSWKIFHFII